MYAFLNLDVLFASGLGFLILGALDISAYDAVLKDVYEKTIIDILNSKTALLDMFQKETGMWEGRQVIYPLNLGRNQGVMATTENGTLPDAGSQQYVQTKIPIRFNHARIQLSIQVIKASKSSKGAWKRAMDQEMKGVVRDLTHDRNRQMFGWGLGVLALVNTDPGTGTTITVDAPMGVAGATNGARFIRANMNVAFINPSNGAIRSGGARAVSSIGSDGTTFVIGSACDAAVADNDYIVRAAKSTTAVVGDTAYNNECMGALGLFDDTTYVTTLNNVNRTTYPVFQTYTFASVGPLSGDIIQRGCDVAEQTGEGELKYFVSHHSVRRAYLTLMESDRRYSGGDLQSPDAGTKAAKMKEVTFGDIPWRVDKMAPYGILFGIDPSYLTRWVEVEGEWADDDGTILLRLQDKDAYEARFRIFDNFSNDRPAASVRWDGITATVVVVNRD